MSSITCPVCREAAGELVALCSSCETPHHPDCWEFARGCAVFACGEGRAGLVASLSLFEALARSASAPLLLLDESSPEAGEPDLGILPGLRPGPSLALLAPASLRGAGSPGSSGRAASAGGVPSPGERIGMDPGLRPGPSLALLAPASLRGAGSPAGAARARESDGVMLVSWVYLAASLGLAIPAVGFLMHGLTGGGAAPVVSGLVCSGAALGLKVLGDQIAVGSPGARGAHLYGCLALGLISVSLPASLTLLLLALPFWTRRGQEHFAGQAG